MRPPNAAPSRLFLIGAVAALTGLAILAAVSVLQRQTTPALTASGTLEAQEVFLGSEVPGRVSSRSVEEGTRVTVGDVLARIDDALVKQQIVQAVEPALRAQLELQQERYSIHSPLTGLVTRAPVRVGEVVAAGQTVVAVADLSTLELTAYVLERDLGRVALGQRVSISADPYPNRSFAGVVLSIKSQAEFTPRNIQTQRDRQNLVLGVKIQVDNRDEALKPGMPADVVFPG